MIPLYLLIHLIGENTIAITGIVDAYREDLYKEVFEEECYHDINYNSKKIENIIIPKEIDGYKVTEIGNRAFHKYTKLITIKIPNSVTNIGAEAFSLCYSLTNITIQKGSPLNESSANYPWGSSASEIIFEQ